MGSHFRQATRERGEATVGSDQLDAPSMGQARRSWMRQYFRANVKSRLAGLGELVHGEVETLATTHEEPAP